MIAKKENAHTNKDSSDLFSPAIAGRYLGGDDRPIPSTTLQWWRTKGRGPKYVKVGRQVRYWRADLDAFLSKSVRDPSSELRKDADLPITETDGIEDFDCH